jgi:hypothetical protein
MRPGSGKAWHKPRRMYCTQMFCCMLLSCIHRGQSLKLIETCREAEAVQLGRFTGLACMYQLAVLQPTLALPQDAATAFSCLHC